MSGGKKVARKEIKAAGEMRRIMTDYYYELDHASKTGDKKIAWCTSMGPVELLKAMGFLVHFPENHGSALGSSRMATDLIPYATALGYSPMVCSYMTSDIGAYLQGVTPLSKAYEGIESMPKARCVGL